MYIRTSSFVSLETTFYIACIQQGFVDPKCNRVSTGCSADGARVHEGVKKGSILYDWKEGNRQRGKNESTWQFNEGKPNSNEGGLSPVLLICLTNFD